MKDRSGDYEELGSLEKGTGAHRVGGEQRWEAFLGGLQPARG